MTQIVLASGSAIRRQLLANAGLKVRSVVHDIDEHALVAGAASSDPKTLARLLAEAKAVSASRNQAEALVIGADQTLDLDGELFTKPSNRKAAKAQLRMLAGRTHQLHSSFAIARGGMRLARQTRSASLTMRRLDDAEIGRYLDDVGHAAMSSVGAYQLEGIGVRLFERIDGDYFTILGLPLLPLLAALRRLGGDHAVTMRTACVIGWPVAHSRSPLIHRYWLQQRGIEGDYVIAPIEPDRIDAFLAGFADSGFVGGNVTVPYKENAFRAAKVDEVAEALGAVNTLWFDGGQLLGTNTDAEGFLANLDHGAPGWDGEGGIAIVLGAGGASRAVVWSLQQRGFDPIVIVNRSLDRANRLAVQYGVGVRPASWHDLGEWLPIARLLVNATTLGMEGQPPPEIDLSLLNASAVVNDLVYAPLDTWLLRDARARGHVTVDGLGMLLHQAVPGFEKWFGVRPEVTPELRALIVADLKAST